MNLTWKRTFEAGGPRGESCVREDCNEYPRVYRMSQRTGVDEPELVLYYVTGIAAQHWHSVDAAIDAMEAN